MSVNFLGNSVNLFDTFYAEKSIRLVGFDTERKPGMYTVKMDAEGSCSLQLRGKSAINVWAGFTQPEDGDSGSHIDSVQFVPKKGGCIFNC